MRPIAKTIATIMLAPFGIALGLLVFAVLGVIAIPLSVRGHFQRRKWFSEMRSSARTITPAGIAERGGSGTLIVDQPGWGGKARHCWWTPDDAHALSHVPITLLADRIESLKSVVDVDDLPLDRWIFKEYLSRETGKAFLVAIKRGDLVASQLQADMRDLQVIETWSAPVSELGDQNSE